MGLRSKIRRFEVWLVTLDPTKGSEIKKTRPCIVISPDSMNKHLNTITIVPLTSTIRNYPTRTNCTFQNKKGQAMIDQIRGLDKSRFLKRLGKMDNTSCQLICDTIVEAYKYQE